MSKSTKVILIIFIVSFLALGLKLTIGESWSVVTVETPKNLKVSRIYKDKVKLSWNEVNGASGYVVRMKNLNTKNAYNRTYSGRTNTNVTRDNMTPGNSYSFYVKAYKTVNGKKIYSKYTSAVSVKTTYVNFPTTLKATSVSTSSVKLSWSKVSDASGYLLYTYDANNKLIAKASYSGANKITGTKTNLNFGTNYKFKIRAYKNVGGKKNYSDYSNILTITTKPKKVNNTDTEKNDPATNNPQNNDSTNSTNSSSSSNSSNPANSSGSSSSSGSTSTSTTKISVTTPTNLKASVSGKTVKLTWSKINGVTGYIILTKNLTKKTESTKTVIGSGNNYLNITNLTAGNKYAFYVKAYKIVNNKQYKSKYTKGLGITVKKSTNDTSNEKTTNTRVYSKALDAYLIQKTNSKGLTIVDPQVAIGNVAIYDQTYYKNKYYACTAKKKFYKGSSGKATISSHGCGPTALSIVLSTLYGINDSKYNPVDITQKVCCGGYCTNAGTAYALFSKTPKMFGLKMKTTNSKAEMLKALKSGNSVVMLSVHSKYSKAFTNGSGHFIVLAGVKGEKIYVANPNNRNKPSGFYSYKTIAGNKKSVYYIYSRA